jgi:starch-binding outer membrane protein, SusD/RagB family
MKLIIKILTLSMVLMVSACDSLLEINPKQSVDPSKTLTAEGIESRLNNIYSYLKTSVMYGRDFVATAEALADNSRIINRAGGRYQQQGSNAINNHLNNWEFAYSAINEINLLLEDLPIADISEAQRTSTEGQAKALRALMLFDLARVYGYEPNMAPPGIVPMAVPIVLNGVMVEADIVKTPRAAQAEVYAQIYADLTDAVSKAPDTGGPAYLTKAGAYALFSKVALYNQDWANAEAYATQALTLTASSHPLVPNGSYVNSWRVAVHPESIFEVTFTSAGESIGVNESVQSAFSSRVSILTSKIGGYGAVVPTTAFMGLFKTATALDPTFDVRGGLYQLGLDRAGSGTIVIETTKFMGKTGTLYMDNIPVIRTSEVYLIRAEARARQGGKDVEALADLNAIHTRAGLTAYGAGLTGAPLINAVIAERRLELAFEGDRWFDLKRRGADVIKSTGNVPYTDFRILAPLPVREIQANGEILIQNPGY